MYAEPTYRKSGSSATVPPRIATTPFHSDSTAMAIANASAAPTQPLQYESRNGGISAASPNSGCAVAQLSGATRGSTSGISSAAIENNRARTGTLPAMPEEELRTSCDRPFAVIGILAGTSCTWKRARRGEEGRRQPLIVGKCDLEWKGALADSPISCGNLPDGSSRRGPV